MATRTRSAVNELVPGLLYQRGQILTWQPEVKAELLRSLGVTCVVNFWPKLDHDLSNGPAMTYLHMPCIASRLVLEPRVQEAARFVARLLRRGNEKALVLCEAGVTRSVFFCVLVVARLEGVGLPEALERVRGRMPRVDLKGFMMDFIRQGAGA
jgi:hypothetical protein